MLTLTRGRSEPALDAFALWSHHPDRLCRPACRPERLRADLIAHALTWNLFRSLELLPPAFWLRRLHARMQQAHTLGRAPVTARVSLWRTLPPSPGQIIQPDSPAVLADVLIETEHVVWTLITTFGADIVWRDLRGPDLDPVDRMIDAGAWLAGRRDYYCGLIVRDPADAPLGVSLMQRHARSTRTTSAAARGIGTASWSDIVEILDDAAAEDTLSPLERSIACSAREWVRGTGLDTDGHHQVTTAVSEPGGDAYRAR